jgi:hypothetical protein
VRVVHLEHRTLSGAGGFASVSYGARCGARNDTAWPRGLFAAVAERALYPNTCRACASCARLAGIEIKEGDNGNR